jgi:hypothetical protein
VGLYIIQYRFRVDAADFFFHFIAFSQHNEVICS